MQRRPNILIFNPDEMRADTLAHLGNPAAITPNIDALVRQDAVSFSNAYCQNPVCVPSRCSFLTGLYPHTRGHRTMSYLLHPGEDTLFTELRRAGYFVWMNDRNDFAAGQCDGFFDAQADEIYYGRQKPHGPGPEQNLRGERGGKNFYSHYEGRLALDENGENYNADDEVIDAAIERLRHPINDKPLCMFLGLMWPHTPYGCEEPYFSAIDKARLPQRIKPEECSGKPKIQALIRQYAGMEQYTEEDWQQLRSTYLGMCMKIDRQLGKIVRALKDAEMYDNTLILFISDHGDFAGDYGLVEKAQNTFEDCLTRVPFIVKPPKACGVDAGISPALTELLDLYATVLDYANVQPCHTHHSRSVRRVVENRQCANRTAVFCEGGRMPGETHCDEYHINGENGSPESFVYWPKQKAQADDVAHGRGIMLRTEKYKYVSRITEPDELYDLTADAGERINLIDAPSLQPLVTGLQGQLLKWLQATVDIVPFAYDARFTPDMLFAMVKDAIPRGSEALVRDYIAKGGRTLPALMAFCNTLKERTP